MVGQGQLDPRFELNPFIPFIALALSRLSLGNSLTLCGLCGLYHDCLDVSFPFGCYTIGYLTTAVLTALFRLHFQDRGLGLALFATLFAATLKIVTLLLLLLEGLAPSTTLAQLGHVMIVYPLLQGGYTLLYLCVVGLGQWLCRRCAYYLACRRRRSPCVHSSRTATVGSVISSLFNRKEP